MCRRITCDRCGKPSYAGCGAHIEQVLSDVPKDQRCKCREASTSSSAPTAGGGGGGGLFGRLFNRAK